jgi:hypothetical protein
MQFAKAQGGALAALGLLLLVLQAYILLLDTAIRQPHSGSGNSNSGRTIGQIRPRGPRLIGPGSRRVFGLAAKETKGQ